MENIEELKTLLTKSLRSDENILKINEIIKSYDFLSSQYIITLVKQIHKS